MPHALARRRAFSTAGWILLLAFAVVATAIVLHSTTSDIPAVRDHGPRIEQIRRIARLAVQRVEVSDVIEGRNAGAEALVIVHGDADLAIDCDALRVLERDAAARTLTLSAPLPRVERARVDHQRTRVYRIQKVGLAAWNPLADPRPPLLEDCMRAAQLAVDAAAHRGEFVESAKLQAESLLVRFIHELGWTAKVTWRDAADEGPERAVADRGPSPQPAIAPR